MRFARDWLFLVDSIPSRRSTCRGCHGPLNRSPQLDGPNAALHFGVRRLASLTGQEPTLEARFNLPESGRSRVRYAVAVKPKQEAELFKAALRAGIRYAESRGAVEFEPTDSASDKALYVYRLLVHDKIITPMPEDQVGEKTVRHRLASWYAHLPPGHPLLS